MIHFTVFGTKICPACDQAKKLLTSKELTFDFIDISNSVEAQTVVKDYWKSKGQRPTVPLIVDNTKASYVGNINQLVEYLKN